MIEKHESSIPIYCKEGKELEYIGAVRKSFLGLLKRQIRFNQDFSLCDNLKYLLFDRGWVPLPPNYTDIKNCLDTINLNTDIGPAGLAYNSLLGTQVPVLFLSDLLAAQVNNEKIFENLFDKMLEQKNIFNIKEFLSVELKNILGYECTDHVNRLIDSIWNVRFSDGGNSVGKGEFCLTFMTGARKALTGDLINADSSRELEIKCTGGKVGAQSYAEGAQKRLANILNMDCDQFLSHISKLRISRKIESKREQLLQEIEEKRKQLIDKLHSTENSLNNEFRDRISAGRKILPWQLSAKDNIKKIADFIDGKLVENINFKNTGIRSSELNMLKKLTEEVNNLTSTNYKGKDIVLTYQQAVKGFFIDSFDMLETPQIIEGFFECRNAKLNNHQQNQLLLAIYEFFFTHPIQELNKLKSLSRLILTLHITCYWLTHKFTDIQFVNDKSKSSFILNMPSKALSLAESFEFIYNRIPPQLKTNLSLGGQNPSGVETYLEC